MGDGEGDGLGLVAGGFGLGPELGDPDVGDPCLSDPEDSGLDPALADPYAVDPCSSEEEARPSIMSARVVGPSGF